MASEPMKEMNGKEEDARVVPLDRKLNVKEARSRLDGDVDVGDGAQEKLQLLSEL